MNKLATEKTIELKKELDRRGLDTSSVKPAKTLWRIGFQKTLWQYQDGIEADTKEQAISIGLSRLSEKDWSDYNNDIEIINCEKTGEV